ncbi:MAG: hypothetical protein GXO80_11090 [Chlorobi bacterium]|nr:hypothetical protein [Chlorobiota bacterium]
MRDFDSAFLSSLLLLYDSFEDHGISLVYVGKFNHTITKVFTALTSEDTEKSKESRSVQRTLHHSMIEILQNMTKHSDNMFHEINFGKGLFMLGKKNDAYHIITANVVNNEQEEELRTSIDDLNACTPDELKAMYKKQLREGKISGKGGAGLGLIDITRKTGNPLDYMFFPADENKKYFVLKVKVDSETSE